MVHLRIRVHYGYGVHYASVGSTMFMGPTMGMEYVFLCSKLWQEEGHWRKMRKKVTYRQVSSTPVKRYTHEILQYIFEVLNCT